MRYAGKNIWLFILVGMLLLAPWQGNGQALSGLLKNFVVTAKAGGSSVVTEYRRDFSGLLNEMSHRPAVSYSLSVSKYFLPRWEAGFEYEQSAFRGFSDHPDFSAYHFGHFKISQMRLEPVIYRSKVINREGFLAYHLKTHKDRRMLPYVYVRGGVTKLLSELRYSSTREIIFAKTGWEQGNSNASIWVDNYTFGVGAGTEYVVNEHIGLTLSLDMNHVNDDNLDAVHNFNEPSPGGYHNFVSGVYSRLMFGISYTLNPDKDRVASRKYRLKDAFNNRRLKRNHYPFYEDKAKGERKK